MAQAGSAVIAQDGRERKERAEGHEHPAVCDAGKEQAERIEQQNAGGREKKAKPVFPGEIEAEAQDNGKPSITQAQRHGTDSQCGADDERLNRLIGQMTAGGKRKKAKKQREQDVLLHRTKAAAENQQIKRDF